MNLDITPGPWHWLAMWDAPEGTVGETSLKPYTGGSCLLMGPDGKIVLQAFAEYEILCKPEDGRVLAAAHEMLSVVSSVAATGLHGPGANEDGCLCSRCELVREAQAVMAKIAGSAP